MPVRVRPQARPPRGRWWRLKYRVNGRERGLSLGVYPAVGLKRAREKREEAKALLADGIDPSRRRQTESLSQSLTLELIGREWLALQQHKLAAVTLSKARWMLESFIFQPLGSHPIGTITAPELLAELRKIEATGAYETAMRTKQRVGQIYRYAIATGRAERDITADLRGALAPAVNPDRPGAATPFRMRRQEGAAHGRAALKVAQAATRPLVAPRRG